MRDQTPQGSRVGIRILFAVNLFLFGFITLPRGDGTIIGTVRDERGTGISSAKVTAKNDESGALTGTAITDESGNYRITPVHYGAYTVTAEAEGYERTSANGTTVEKAGSTRIDFVLRKGTLIDSFMNISEPTHASKLEDRAEGGHTSLGIAPPQVSYLNDIQEATQKGSLEMSFEEVSIIPEKTYCGGPSKDHILESGGAGVALLDYNRDGLLDIFLVNAYELTSERDRIPHGNLLYRNLGDWKFQNVSRSSGIDHAAWGMGVCAGDYNDDGYLDLYVTNFGPNFLYRNNGDGTFSEVAAQAGVDFPGWSTGCAFFDADADGDLDLYVANYVDCTWDEAIGAQRTYIWRGGPKVMVGPVGLKPSQDLFYRNEGNGHFVEHTAVSGFRTKEAGYGFGVLATDYDNDSDQDLYVANDSTNNFLFRNRGQGQFEEVGMLSGAALSGDGRAQASMGVDSADVDSDGFLDLIVTNFARDYNTLYRNLRGGWFEDASEIFGLKARTFERLGWGAAFFDADLDGDVDLFTANGHLYPQVDDYPELIESFQQKNQIFLNENGKLLDVSEAAGNGLRVKKSSRGLAIGDLDNDGRPDVVVTNMDDVPTVLRNRYSGANHWTLLQLNREGVRNRFCIGSRVVITAGRKKQVREVRSGGSYLSQNDLRVHFGLGSYEGPVEVEVQLAGSGKWRWKGIPANGIASLTLSEETRVY